ncbi:uncharacterized protein [Haliotis asinina]|uniref:uncharacterized protein n=1 Tax=Haliotis asinina TaxID=109174 RepID=UPI003531E6B7
METNRTSSHQNKRYQEPEKGNNVLYKRPPSGGNRHLNNSNSSSLEILEPEETSRKKEHYRDHRQASSAKRGNHAGSVPPRPDSSLTRRTPTPTKQISLQAVRRKEERDDPIVADVDWKELESQRRNKGRKNGSLTENFQELHVADKDNISQEQSSIPFSYSSRHHNCSHHHEEKTAGTSGRCTESKETKKVTLESKEDGGSGAAGGKGESSDDSDSEEEDEDRKAPNQLLMEFVTCLMEKDYLNAQKLCKMILLYEPDNAEALKFQPLIDEKIELDQEEEMSGSADSDDEGVDEDDEGEGDSDEDSDEDSEADSDDSDSDDDSSDSDSDDHDDGDDDNETQEDKLDSGIASAAGSVHFSV